MTNEWASARWKDAVDLANGEDKHAENASQEYGRNMSHAQWLDQLSGLAILILGVVVPLLSLAAVYFDEIAWNLLIALFGALVVAIGLVRQFNPWAAEFMGNSLAKRDMDYLRRGFTIQRMLARNEGTAEAGTSKLIEYTREFHEATNEVSERQALQYFESRTTGARAIDKTLEEMERVLAQAQVAAGEDEVVRGESPA